MYLKNVTSKKLTSDPLACSGTRISDTCDQVNGLDVLVRKQVAVTLPEPHTDGDAHSNACTLNAVLFK
jgi:hypothetical protein